MLLTVLMVVSSVYVPVRWVSSASEPLWGLWTRARGFVHQTGHCEKGHAAHTWVVSASHELLDGVLCGSRAVLCGES